MATLLEQIRAASPDERRHIFTEMVKDAIAGDAARPVVVKDETAATIAYLTPTLGGERVFPEITPEVIAKVQERMKNPGKLLTADQFLDRLDHLIEARQSPARSESVR